MQGGEAIFILLKTGSSKAFIEGMNESWQSSEAYQGIYFSSMERIARTHSSFPTPQA